MTPSYSNTPLDVSTTKPTSVITPGLTPEPTQRSTPEPTPVPTSTPAPIVHKRIVVTQTNGAKATLTAYIGEDGKLEEVFLSCDALIGRNGVSYDRTAGDKTTPGGTFTFGTGFGLLDDPGGVSNGYRKITKDDYWVGDSSSKYYNQWRSLTDPDKDWRESSSEHLIDYVGYYDYALAINFNFPDTIPGKGSAIFLHCIGENSYTAGCVAVSTENMLELLRFVESGTTIEILAAGE